MEVSVLCPLPPHFQRSLDPTPGPLAPLDLLVVQTHSPAGRAEAQGGQREGCDARETLLECSILKDRSGGKQAQLGLGFKDNPALSLGNALTSTLFFPPGISPLYLK